MIDQTTIDRIFDASQIMDVVQDYVTLKRRGVNYIGLCPFHNEKTPSFSVSPSRNIYKCFGCGKGGNPVNFIMEHEKINFYEALKYLAARYHIDIVESHREDEDIQQKSERESMLLVTNFATKAFVNNLLKEDEGRTIGLSYFKERGFRDDTIEKFQLGYCLEQRNDFTGKALKEGYNLEFLVKTGLTIQNENYPPFDRFSGRVMFPIHNLTGKVIAFGGRVMKTDRKIAKYLNSPESEIYHKSNVLYGIFQAKQSIIKENKCYLVEGYTDVISMHQAGIENVVASSGTSLTVEQIRLIRRFSNNITILYDGDPAGIKASLRGIDLVLEEGMNVRVILLPAPEDPDSFARKHSSSEITDYLRTAETDFIHFKTNLLLADAQNDPVKRGYVISDIVKSISIIPDAIVRSLFLHECSGLLQVSEQILYSEVSNQRRAAFSKNLTKPDNTAFTPEVNNKVASNFEINELEVVEKEIIRIMLNFGSFPMLNGDNEDTEIESEFTVQEFFVREISQDELEFSNVVYRKIFQEYQHFISNGDMPDSKYFIYHNDSEICKTAADLVTEKYELSKRYRKLAIFVETEEMRLKSIVPEIILIYKSKRIMLMIKEIQDQLLNAQSVSDFDTLNALQQKIIVLNNFKRELSKNLRNRIIM
jgi:DNA primase